MVGSLRGRGRFSRREVIQLIASMVALTLAFLFVLPEEPGAVFTGEVALEAMLQAKFLGTAVAVAVTGFLFHELAHKFVAQMYGHWSEFRASYGQLSLAVFVGAAFGILFAAPGAVNIMGNVDEKENGIISAVGPLTNIVMAAVFLALWQMQLRDPLWGFVYEKAAFFNVFLAAFNLVPMKPLDGSKVVAWNIGVYLALILIIVLQLTVLFPSLFAFLP